jgi:PBP1b-binding outer membrane lipoprotein LpoB
MPMRVLALIPALFLSGCVSTVGSVVTAPFKVVGKAADWATTSQSEADRNRGREIRKAEEKARKQCKREVESDYDREQCARNKLREWGVY